MCCVSLTRTIVRPDDLRLVVRRVDTKPQLYSSVIRFLFSRLSRPQQQQKWEWLFPLDYILYMYNTSRIVRERGGEGKPRTFPIYFPSRESVKRSTDDSNLETNWREFCWFAFSGADVVVVSWHSKWLEGKSGVVIQLDWRALLVKRIRRHQQSIRCEFHGRPGRWRRGKGSSRIDVMDCQQ